MNSKITLTLASSKFSLKVCERHPLVYLAAQHRVCVMRFITEQQLTLRADTMYFTDKKLCHCVRDFRAK